MNETLHCTVCQSAIPESRATRITATCSEKCKNRLDQIRIHQRQARKCPACLHPATPEEREAYRIWRAERGDIKTALKQNREYGGPNKREMRQALRDAARAIRILLERLEVSQPTPNPSDASCPAPEAGNGHIKNAANLLARLKDLYEPSKTPISAP